MATPSGTFFAAELWTAVNYFPHAWCEVFDALGLVADPTPLSITIVTSTFANTLGPLVL